MTGKDKNSVKKGSRNNQRRVIRSEVNYEGERRMEEGNVYESSSFLLQLIWAIE